jgi:hypothetical protein
LDPPPYPPLLPLPLVPLSLVPLPLVPLDPPERPPLPVGSAGAEVVVLPVVVVVVVGVVVVGVDVVGVLAEGVDVEPWLGPLAPLDGVDPLVPPWVGLAGVLCEGFAKLPPPLVWVGPFPVEPLEPEGWDGDVTGMRAELGELGVVGVDVVGVLGVVGVGWVPLPNADDPRYGALPAMPDAGGVTPTMGVEGLSGFVAGAEPDRPDRENGCSTATGAPLALRRPAPTAAVVQAAEEPVATTRAALAEPGA